jgi:site-specific DNA-cytosine methylase
MTAPLAIDLCCGLGGWTEGLLAEGWRVRGYDIEEHEYGEERYPAELVLRNVLEMHGSEIEFLPLGRHSGVDADSALSPAAEGQGR